MLTLHTTLSAPHYFTLILDNSTMGSKLEIALTGEASIQVPAERAVLGIKIFSKSQSRDGTACHVLGTARKIESLLRNLGPQSTTKFFAKEQACVDFWTRTSLIETDSRPYDSKNETELPREYTAAINFGVHFQDFQSIEAFIQRLVGLPIAQTQDVKWVLKQETKDAYCSKLRTQAAKNAHRNALEYAQALGFERVVPHKLEEAQICVPISNRIMSRIPTGGVERSGRDSVVDESRQEEVKRLVDRLKFEYQPEDIEMSVVVKASFYAV